MKQSKIHNLLRGGGLPVALIPLALQAGYILSVWRWAPLDAFSPVYAVLALFAAIAVAWVSRKAPMRFSPWGALPLLLGLGGCLFFTHVQSIHFPYLICAIAVIAGWVWAAFGWEWCWRLTPAWLLLTLCLPSVPFELQHRMSLLGLTFGGAWLQAIAGAIVICAVFPATQWLPVPPAKALLFAGLLALCTLGLTLRFKPVQTGTPAFLAIEDYRRAGWEGHRFDLTDFDRTFFGDNDAIRATYIKNRQTVGVLAISLKGSIHQIHRPDVCLRSGGYAIDRYEADLFPLSGGGSLSGVLMEIARPGEHALVLTWFASPECSIGHYMAFRWRWNQADGWWSYIVQTPILFNDRAAAEKLLLEFIETFRKDPGSKE